MEEQKNICMIITTFDNEEEMTHVIDELLSNNLAACIQTTKIQSHYIWKNEVCRDSEIRVAIKTKWEKVEEISSIIKAMHSYQVPEIIAINIDQSDQQYAKWIEECVQ